MMRKGLLLSLVGLAAWAGAPSAAASTVAEGARATRTTAQSIANDTWTAISLDGETWDTGALHDGGTNPSRITVGESGLYVATAAATFAVHSAGARYAAIAVNGTRIYQAPHPAQRTDTDISLRVMDVLSLTAGDYVELHVYQNRGGALDVRANGAYLSVAGWFDDGTVGTHDHDSRYCLKDGSESDPDCASGGGGTSCTSDPDCTTQTEFDDYVLASHTCGDPEADPVQPPCAVALDSEDSDRLDRAWLGVWAGAGLLLVLLIVPAWQTAWRFLRE